MAKKKNAIPVNKLAENYNAGVVIARIVPNQLQSFEEANHAHRHDFHIFIFARRGSIAIEIDFKQHNIHAPALLYIHPTQVHRILNSTGAEAFLMGISSDALQAAFLSTLEQTILPASVLILEPENAALIEQTAILCEQVLNCKHEPMYIALVKVYSNALVGLSISAYLKKNNTASAVSRFDIVTKAFKLLLEQNYTKKKRPADYASALNMSTAYLNECVRHATGFPLTYHIQQRTVLEAKRLLYHSDKSVKEIANQLGFDDHAYFSRLFSKITGTSAVAFRTKNLE